MTTALLNNRYRILQTLGRGGFGQTFLATDTHMPSARKCVIKQLKPINQDPEVQQWVQDRFQREAAILEQLGEESSQIPRLYAYFLEAGNFYLVQEWIQGVTLTQKQEQQGTLSEDEVQKILISLLPVLDYVHSRRIVHRDVKPDNIILRTSDGKPVLIDFGAVKEAMTTMVFHEGITPFSVAIGTPGYIPSEQAAGRPIYSSDLYSLGLTAIYLLTGKTPQNLETDSHTGEILWRQETPNLHSNLATVIERAISFHPRDRFSSAREMLESLQSQTVNSTTATLVVSPENLPSRANTATETQTEAILVPTNPPIEKGNGWLKLLLPLLLLGGVGVGAFAIGLNLSSDKERSRPIASSPEPIEQPTFPIESPSPEATPTPSPETIPSPTPSTTPEPPEVIIETTRESPQVPPSPSPEPPQITSSPLPTRVSPSPKPTPEGGNRESLTSLPIFVTGTEESKLLEALGEPTSNRKGYWPNSRAWLYKDFVPNQVDLGYIFETNTGRLRQTEVSFAPSVDLEVMQKTLNGLLGGNTPPLVKEGLKQIYQRQNDLRSFRVGNLKGMIHWNQKDRIYIAIWEADFH
ncbi:MAG: protein kinase [Xenococcaceae cyanobacterium]